MTDTKVRELLRRRAETMQGVREVRRMASVGEVRESAGGMLTFSGLASRTATPYDMGGYQEQIARGAFTNTLNRNPDVQLLVNHEGLPLARTTIPAGQPGALALRESSDGLVFDANCDPTDPDVARLASKINSGLMDQCSFAFRVIQQKWNWADDEAWAAGTAQDERNITEVSLDRGDVSVCNYGANPNTSISARSLAELTDEELAEYGLARAERRAVAAEPVVETPAKPVHSLDYYKARAFVLGLGK